MANVYWRGGAAAIAQVDTYTPSITPVVGDVHTLSLWDEKGIEHTISFTATDVTVANVTAGLTAAAAATSDPEWAKVTVADVTTHITITADTAGVPFVCEVSSKEVEDCEDAFDELVDGDVTSTAVARGKVGTNCIQLVVAAGCAANDILATEVVSHDLQLYGSVGMWIKSSVDLAAGDVNFLLDETAQCAGGPSDEVLAIPALIANKWAWVSMTFAGAAATRDAIISVGFEMQVDKGAFTLWADDIQASYGTLAHTTASRGPNDVQTPENFQGTALPADADTVYVEGDVDDILYGLDNKSVLLEGFYVQPGCTAAIGSARTYLKIDTNTFQFHGTGQAWIDINDLQNAPMITSAASNDASGEYGLNIASSGTWAGAALAMAPNLSSGQTLALAAQAGETFTLTGLSQKGGVLVIGTGLTITTITASQAEVRLYGTSLTTVRLTDCTSYWKPTSVGMTTLTVEGGVFHAQIASLKTITTLNAKGTATIDFSEASGGAIVTNAEIFGSATIKDPFGKVSWTNGLHLNDTNLDTITLDMPMNKTWTLT